MKQTFLFLFLLLGVTLTAQSLTLESCYELTEKNYPLVKQRNLIKLSTDYTVQNLTKGFYPQVSVYGQATYQSDVTRIPINLPNVEPASKDQYKLYAEATQTLYDGGMIKQQKQLQKASAEVEQQKVEVELYKLKERINQLYFGILSIDEQLKQTDLVKSDLQLGINKTQAAVDNGIALKMNVNILKAEVLKVNQRVIELKSGRKAFLEMLGLFINQPLDENTTLTKPEPIIPLMEEVKRPELSLFNSQNKSIDFQNELLKAKNRPRISLFAQGGLGRPAMNMLNNDFQGYYLVGTRISYPLSGFYTLKNEQSLLDINRKTIQVQKENFLFNIEVVLAQQREEMRKIGELINLDNEIIELRKSIKTTAAAQLENGVSNTNDYLREVNAEDAARQAKIVHEIQYLQAIYTKKTTMNN